jgi:hypothetical protein
MLQIDEYGFALVLLLVGMGAFSIQAYDWRGIEGHSRATRVLKTSAVVLILFSLVYFSAVIVRRRGDKPWAALFTDKKEPAREADQRTRLAKVSRRVSR